MIRLTQEVTAQMRLSIVQVRFERGRTEAREGLGRVLSVRHRGEASKGV